MFKVYNKNTRTTSLTSFWCFYYELWTYFTPFSSVPIVNFEQVNVSWVTATLDMVYAASKVRINDYLIMVSVVISSATLVPSRNLALSTPLLIPTTYRGPLVTLTIYFSSVSCFRTWPTIWPTLCKAFKLFSDLS